MINIDGKTKLYAVLGSPISHSLSPLLHNTAFEYLELNSCYVAFQVEAKEMKEALGAVKCLGIGGVNLTHPLKEVAQPYLDQIDEKARLVGAVNTVVNREGNLVGYNTDVEGFRWSLLEEAGWDRTDSPVVMIGAGGAARAVAVSLAETGVSSIKIHNRTSENATEILDMLSQRYGVNGEVFPLEKDALAASIKNTSLLVNTLPMDPMDADGKPFYKNLRHLEETTVYDLRYSPPVPTFLDWARQAGARTFNGLGMLMAQAAEALEYFTNRQAPRELMLKKAREYSE